MPDFLGSIVVFTVVISLFLFSWNAVTQQQVGASSFKLMREDARYTMSLLASTPGYPENWTNETVEIPGFATEDNVVSARKIEEFAALNYSQKSKLLQAGNFNLTLSNSSGVMTFRGVRASFGRSPENASVIVPVERSVLVNLSGDMISAELRLVTWR
ncbi:MAG: hypothetical protein ABEJ98_02165 [Candidatus Nanohaloarchaea archaeon]